MFSVFMIVLLALSTRVSVDVLIVLSLFACQYVWSMVNPVSSTLYILEPLYIQTVQSDCSIRDDYNFYPLLGSE